MEIRKGITVYCASSDNIDPIYYEAARQLGAEIARRGYPVVNGAGRMGLMAAVTDGAMDEGGEAYGVIPQFMYDRGLAYSRLSRLFVTPDMASRKNKLAELSIGVIALPGGVGTLEELAEMMAKRKLELYDGEVVILNTNHYYDSLIRMLDESIAEGFTYGGACWTVASTPAEAVEAVLKGVQ